MAMGGLYNIQEGSPLGLKSFRIETADQQAKLMTLMLMSRGSNGWRLFLIDPCTAMNVLWLI